MGSEINAAATPKSRRGGPFVGPSHREEAPSGAPLPNPPCELKPNLYPESVAVLYLPEDGQVNSPRLVQALALGATRRGARLMEATRVEGLVVEGRKVTGVRTAQGKITAGAVVLAGGTSSPLLARELGLRLPVHPVKGEILAVNAACPCEG